MQDALPPRLFDDRPLERMRVMKCLAVLMALLAGFSANPILAAEIPHEVAGFAIGQDVATVSDRLQMDTLLPLRYQEYLQEVEIKPLTGFKSGLIIYGNCAQPGRIVRIKLKYADHSRPFYDALLAQMERRFGKPTAYEGDPFHVVIEWKWSFIDTDGQRISLHLGHNSRDTEEKFGNAVKLTFNSAISEEHQCFRDKNPKSNQPEANRTPSLKSMTAEDWQPLIPQ
jgi:hypothetical protein